MKPLIKWLTESGLQQIYSTGYWNDIEEEKSKPWWIEDGDYQKCLDYLEKSGLKKEFDTALSLTKINTISESVVVDLAAGIAWMSALLTKLPSVKEVHAVEISQHRINLLAPHSFKMLSGIEEKFYRYLGSFYDIKLKENSCDFIFLSQAFHHADKPLKLLMECDKILKVGGQIVLIGEHYINNFKVFKKCIGRLLRGEKIHNNFYKNFPPDPVLGDHYYRLSDYDFLFNSLGYSLEIKYLPFVKRAVMVGTKQ